MASYEVQTEDLLGIRDQLAVQAKLLAHTLGGISTAAAVMVDQVGGGSVRAQTTIDTFLAHLADVVARTDQTATYADWLGPDGDRFRLGNSELGATIGRSRNTIEAA